MDFLENVMSAVGSAAQTVVKKSGEVVEYSKLKYSMFDLSNSIKNLYSQIGEAVYISYKNHTPLDENVKDKCAEIDKLNDMLEELDDQLGDYKAIVKCPKCGKGVKDHCSYCPYCGEKLSEDVDAEFYGDTHKYYSPSSSEPVDDEPDKHVDNDAHKSDSKTGE